jgi:prevent-host-death family protein
MTETVNIHEAKTHLSRLVEQAAKGREFVIAKAGKPMVRVIAVTPPSAKRSLGFMVGQGVITADLKKAFAADIAAMFPAP